MGASNPETVVREELDVPADAPVEILDVREMGPPAPLTETLEALVDMDEDVVLIQINDRAPKHLFPKLDERGYEYGTVQTDDGAVTAIWNP